MGALNGRGYKLIAQALGRALEFLRSSGRSDQLLWVIVDVLIADLTAENPRFDAARFVRIIHATAEAEQDSIES